MTRTNEDLSFTMILTIFCKDGDLCNIYDSRILVVYYLEIEFYCKEQNFFQNSMFLNIIAAFVASHVDQTASYFIMIGINSMSRGKFLGPMHSWDFQKKFVQSKYG